MLQTKMPLVFIDERRGESKNGKPYQFIKLANPQTFENYELFAEGIVVDVPKGCKVNVELSLNSNFGRTGVSIVGMSMLK